MTICTSRWSAAAASELELLELDTLSELELDELTDVELLEEELETDVLDELLLEELLTDVDELEDTAHIVLVTTGSGDGPKIDPQPVVGGTSSLLEVPY